MFKERICLSNLTEESWTDAHMDLIDEFVNNSEQRLLVAYVDTINGFTLEPNIPYASVEEITYFIRKDSAHVITSDNFLTNVQYGSVTKGHIQSLLRLMSGIYAPIFFENTTWPDSIKNGFSAQLHRFLASLTDTRWKIDGKTVLYIPSEGLNLEVEVAAKNKELVQRIESELFYFVETFK